MRHNANKDNYEMTWEEIARKLWSFLDDVDTADDFSKSDDALYRNLTREAHEKRWQTLEDHEKRWQLSTSDGLDVSFNVKETR